jgi:uroporphyrinogen-III synthase
MKVIVTRPAESAARTAETLKAMGHDPLLLMLFEAENDAAGVKEARAVDVQAIVVTSGQALEALGTAGNLAAHPLFAVGARTAEKARSIGFRQVEAASGNGAALAALLAQRFAEDARPALLYLTGEPRNPRLEQELAAARFPLKLAVCYRMRPLELPRKALDDLFAARPEAVLLYSAATAQRFFKLASEHMRQSPEIRVICLSATIAAHVPQEFAQRTRFAATPIESELLALL